VRKPEGDHPIHLLSASIDGELTPSERAGLEAHLAACADCTRALVDLRRIDSALEREAVEPLPGDLEARILSGVRGGGRGRLVGFPVRGWRIPAAAAAALSGVLALWVTFSGIDGLAPGDRDGLPELDGGGAESGAGMKESLERRDGTPEPTNPTAGGDPGQSPAAPESRLIADDKDAPVEALSRPAERGASHDSMANERASPSGGGSPAGPAPEPRAALPEDAPEAIEAKSEREALRIPGGIPPPPKPAAPALAPGRAKPLSGPPLAASSPATEERVMALHEAGTTIRISKAGRAELFAEGYSCAIRVAPAPDLFSAAADLVARSGISPSERGKEAGKPDGAAVHDEDGPFVTLTDLDGISVALPRGEEAAALAAQIRKLASEAWRKRFEEACGPLPAGLGR
jgi:hypothetical protein